MPFTEVTGDMGTEGRREQLLGKGDLDELLAKIRETLSSTLINDPVPSAEDLDLALLLRTEKATITVQESSVLTRIKTHKWSLISATSGVIAALAIGGVIS